MKAIKNTILYSLLFVVFTLQFPVNTSAQDITASAPAVVSTQKAFNYSISAQKQGEISLPDLEGIRIISGPRQMVSYRSSNINGKLTTTTQVTYSYMMVAEEEGEYTIPPATLEAEGKTYRSNPVKIRVVAGAQQARPGQGQSGSSESPAPSEVILRLIPSKTKLFEGEQLLVSTRIFVRTRIERPSLDPPSFEGFWVETLDPDANVRNERIEGYNYNSQVVKRDLLTAQRKGNITIDPAILDVTILKRTQRPRSRFDDFFDDPFFSDPFDRYERETRVISSNSLNIEVKPLPQGAPAGFDGAVGSFSVSARLMADSVRTNDAVSLVVEIQGKGNLNLIEAPDLDFPPDLEVFEPKRSSNINHSRSGTEGKVEFEYVIIPRHNGNYRISPLRFSYFNPEKVEYESFSSSEFRFTAYGGSDDARAENDMQPGLFREDVRTIDRDIRYIKLEPGNLTLRNSFLIVKAWVYIYIFGGLALLILIVLIWRNKIRKEADIFYVRNKKAHKVARKRLKNANRLMEQDKEEFYEEILKAFWGYLGDRLSINTADLSKDRISAELEKRNLDEDMQRQLWEIVEECEYSRYSPESGEDKRKLYERSEDCIRKLEQKI